MAATDRDKDNDKARRERGEGSLYWDAKREVWVYEETIGYTPAGRRIKRKRSGKTKTEAREKYKQAAKEAEAEAELPPESRTATVADAVQDWLRYGLVDRDPATVTRNRILCNTHIVADLGPRKLRDLSARDVDRWLEAKAKVLSTSTVRRLHASLDRIITRAMARELVRRNVVQLCEIPRGQVGRPSKSLTFDQARAVLDAAAGTSMHAYIVVSLLTGARTEELRALRWEHVDLDGRPDQDPPVLPSVQVWRSVRGDGDTKTRKSRRTLALPRRAVDALRDHLDRQKTARDRAGSRWRDHGLVFASQVGTPLLAGNVRRSMRLVLAAAGLDAGAWTPRELRHSFVSIMSDSGVRIEDIAELVGHAGTRVTEAVYRHQLRPVVLNGAVVMDRIFADGTASGETARPPD